jgi:hypothetical protein
VHHSACLPFDGDSYGAVLLSIGYVVATITLMPLGMMDMKENAAFQKLSFILLVVFLVEFVISFILSTKEASSATKLSLWGSDYSQLLGVVLFNFSLTPTIPAWLHEKDSKTSVQKVICHSNLIVVCLYIIIGTTGSVAIKHVPANFLAFLSSGKEGVITQVAANLFSFFIIGFGVPLFSIIMVSS